MPLGPKWCSCLSVPGTHYTTVTPDNFTALRWVVILLASAMRWLVKPTARSDNTVSLFQATQARKLNYGPTVVGWISPGLMCNLHNIYTLLRVNNSASIDWRGKNSLVSHSGNFGGLVANCLPYRIIYQSHGGLGSKVTSHCFTLRLFLIIIL
jgi:hypothetical protein